MHQMSPGVERALAAARTRAAETGAPAVALHHLALALLEDDEGRPAVLLERAGLALAGVRAALEALAPVAALDDEVLFGAARDWSITYRYDPEFLTDAFLLAVLRAVPAFEREAAVVGLDAAKLEAVLLGRDLPTAGETAEPAPLPAAPTEPATPLAVLVGPDAHDAAAAARVVDVCFNRAREAARVLEDYCRFALDDRFLTEQVKGVRHALGAAALRVPQHLLLAARDTRADVGTSVTAAGEYDRTTLAQVAVANLKRLQESLRSLEEFGKLFGPELGREVEALRYRAYTLERAVASVGRNRERLADAKLYVLLTAAQCAASLDWTIAQAAAGGAGIIQLREKNLSDRELVSRARDVRRWTEKAGVLFIVNDRPDVARLVGADGVHLGQDDMTVADARRVVGPDALIGVSTHTVEQVRGAVLDGADYIGIGPVFPSKTKAFDDFPGLQFVQAATAETSLPAFALGGIGPDNLGQVVAAGARRVAVSSAVAAADEPEHAARLLRAGLEPALRLGEP